MAAANIYTTTRVLVAQESGSQPFFAPNPSPLPPMHTVGGGIDTLSAGMTSGDIAALHDTGEDAAPRNLPRVLMSMGDIWGPNGLPTATGIVGVDLNIRHLDTTQPTRAASALTQAIVSTPGGGSLANWPTYGYMNAETGVGPGGWAIYAYFGKTVGIDTVTIEGCFLLAGGGTITPGMQVAVGDPRANGGFRNNAIASTTDTNLAGGFTLDRMKTNTAGTATEPFGHGSNRVGSPSWPNAYPIGAGAPLWTLAEPLKIVFGQVVAKVDRPILGYRGMPVPSPVKVIFGGYNGYHPTTNQSGAFTMGALPATLTVGSTSGMVTAAGTPEERRVAVECTNGQFAILEYATAASGTQLATLTLIIGDPSWVAVVGGKVIQGVENMNVGIGATDFPLYAVGADCNNYNAQVPVDPNVFTVGAFLPNRAGGQASGFVWRAYSKYLDPAALEYDPVGAPRLSTITYGGTWTDHSGGTDWDGVVTNKRQVGCVSSSYYFPNYLGLFYSDNGGKDWTESATRWESGPNADSVVWTLGNLYHHTDGYIYTATQPCNIMARVLATDILDKTAWRYSNGATWASTLPTSGDISAWKLFNDTPLNGTQVGYVASLNVWYVTYATYGGVFIRFMDDPHGAGIGPPRLVTVAGEAEPGTTYPWPYGGWVHPFSGRFGNPANVLYVTVTLFKPYQVYLLAVTLTDAGGVDNRVEDTYNVQRFRPGGAIAEWDSWQVDTHPWVRTGNHTFTIAADARGYLGPDTKVSYNDGAVDYGVIGSVTFASGTTTVNLIPNTSYAMAAVTITAPRFSHYHPPSFPNRFLWAPAPTNYSAVPAGGIYAWSLDGEGWIVCNFAEPNAGTHNATATGMLYGLPIAAKGAAGEEWTGTCTLQNNVVQSNACSLSVTAGAAVAFVSSAYAKVNGFSPSTPCRILSGSLRYPYA